MKTVLNILMVIGILLILFFGIAYHFWAPCSVHRRIDTLKDLPARCQQ